MKQLLITMCIILLGTINTTLHAITLKTKCKITDKNGTSISRRLINLNSADQFSQKLGEFAFDVVFSQNNQKGNFNVIIKKNDKVIKEDSFTTFLDDILNQTYTIEEARKDFPNHNYHIKFVLKTPEQQENTTQK